MNQNENNKERNPRVWRTERWKTASRRQQQERRTNLIERKALLLVDHVSDVFEQRTYRLAIRLTLVFELLRLAERMVLRHRNLLDSCGQLCMQVSKLVQRNSFPFLERGELMLGMGINALRTDGGIVDETEAEKDLLVCLADIGWAATLGL